MAKASATQRGGERAADRNVVRPFHVNFPEAELTELRGRVQATKPPERETVTDQLQGVSLAPMRDVLRYRATGYDWRRVEAKLNTVPQVTTEIEGLDIDFIHVRSKHPNALPLIVTQGWPRSIIEQLKIIGPLTDPTAFGGRAEDAFDVVIPSLRFSGKPAATGRDLPRVARACVVLMKRLGYVQFVTQGGDLGARVAEAMALQGPPELIGFHTNMPAAVPDDVSKAIVSSGPVPFGLSAEERRTFQTPGGDRWENETAYNKSRLVYDVGMNNGDDCAYYLSKGYEVVAIEANPTLVQRARERFGQEIADRRLFIEWVGIVDQPGNIPFWICDERDVFSSFDATRAGRNGLKCHPIEVECVTFDTILHKYGIPYYLKIDIEGAEPYCLKYLSAMRLPPYISLEAEDLQWLVLLQQLGYSEFKIVDQMRHNSRFPDLANTSVFSRSAKQICWYADRLKNRLGSPFFPRGSSGPLGEQTPGEWQSFEEVASNWLHMRLGHYKSGTLNRYSWFDFHARASRSLTLVSEMPHVGAKQENVSLPVTA